MGITDNWVEDVSQIQVVDLLKLSNDKEFSAVLQDDGKSKVTYQCQPVMFLLSDILVASRESCNNLVFACRGYCSEHLRDSLLRFPLDHQATKAYSDQPKHHSMQREELYKRQPD